MTTSQTRFAIRRLLDTSHPADAMAAYYAFHHSTQRTQLITTPDPNNNESAIGYIALSQTGIDLFRPLITLRLPIKNLELSATIIKRSITPGMEAFLACPIAYEPLIRALFEVRSEESLALYTISKAAFTPIVNILVTREDQADLPRYVIKRDINGQSQAVAAAGLNWLSPTFGEIAVRTWSEFRRQGLGRSVVSSLVNHLFTIGRRPLYAVALHNKASLELAQSIGFADSGYRQLMLEVIKR